MMVLLIDGVGRKRLMEVPHLLPTIRVPMHHQGAVWREDDEKVMWPTVEIVTFERTNEPSYPPVYRMVPR